LTSGKHRQEVRENPTPFANGTPFAKEGRIITGLTWAGIKPRPNNNTILQGRTAFARERTLCAPATTPALRATPPRRRISGGHMMIKLLSFAAVILLLTACSPRVELPDVRPTPEPTPRPPAEHREDYSYYDIISRLDGSTATIPLSEEILLERLGTAEGLTHNRTHQAYLSLIAGESDLIFVTYPSEEEFALAERAGVELEIIPVVKDALVFLRNSSNSVETLSQRQIRGIYTGEITNWSQVGGDNEPITAFQRPENSGSQTLFLKLAMDNLTPDSPPLELRPAGMGDLVDAVASYDNARNALGFSVFYYVSDMYVSGDVSLMAIDGIEPTRETIAAGTYSYITYYYAVMRKDTPEDHPMRELVDWLLTDDGQTVAQRAGYVPMRMLNQRLDESGYGFFGSTPENTTMSSGTGGTEFLTVDLNSSKWLHPRTSHVDLSSDPELERQVNAWVEQTMESFGNFNYLDSWLNVMGDILVAVVWAYDGGDTSHQERAVFDLNKGKRLKLSDLFYDGVNYIEFINSRIANMITRNIEIYWHHLFEETFDGFYLKRPFTGIPNDYARFGMYLFDGPVLQIIIDGGNPFFDSEHILTFDIFLPIDLSPYGLIYDISYERVNFDGSDGVLVPSVQTGTQPSRTDDIINAKIRTFAETTLISEPTIYNMPSLAINNGNITVGYFAYDSHQSFSITINLRTGETVD
jgi:phosphate transport system substrate-binding protein